MTYKRTRVIDIQAEILTQFSKPEIMEVANDFGLGVSPSDRVAVIVDRIFECLAENSVPDQVTELMLQFLVAAEVLDEDANQIDYIDEETAQLSEADFDELPPCYGLADDRDPACRRCRALTICMPRRISNRPPCFGVAFDVQADECMKCMEASFCRVA